MVSRRFCPSLFCRLLFLIASGGGTWSLDAKYADHTVYLRTPWVKKDLADRKSDQQGT